ncbi:rod shape-determining protein RodA [Patescibacteria group bacterium]|nr:rod shape-determining protein RodA [Patescibacteria group bacterium]
MLFRSKTDIDWMLFFATLPLVGAGLITMNSFMGSNYFFEKQSIWAMVSILVFFLLSFVDFSFLKRSKALILLFFVSVGLLASLFIMGSVFKGAQSWFSLGFLSFQPADFIKIVTILLLAKYFSKRHIEIAHVKHILISGMYAFTFFALVALQPDFGSAIIIFLIWLGMILVSGVSKKHLLGVFLVGIVAFGGMWNFVFESYQKDRIMTFIHPLADIRGAGYNAYQSTIAVGSGQIFGKGVGYGTQSRLQFLPEHETDFIFASFAEEWGFVGVLILFFLYLVVIWRILINASHGSSNFETLFGLGLAVLFISHFAVNIGTNIGLLPVTGVTIPFMSYGGSHLLAEYVGLGILMSMRSTSNKYHKDDTRYEFLGV